MFRFILYSMAATPLVTGLLAAQTDLEKHDQSKPMPASHAHELITTPSGARMLPGGVDGKVTPDLIPDALAYRLFLSAMAEPANATAEQQSRQQRKLARVRLSDADLNALIPILADFSAQQHAIEQSFQDRVDAAAGNDLGLQRNNLASAARAKISASLSPPGSAQLDQLIRAEKRHMAIYPYPSQH